MLEAKVKPQSGGTPLKTVFAAVNELPTPLKFGLYTTVGLGVMAVLGGCMPQSPGVIHEIADCGGQTEIDIAQGSLEKIKANKGGEAKVIFNEGGTITLNGITMDANPNEYYFGELSENHLALEIQGDVDNDGKMNLSAESVCPAPPKPTATVSPTPTPALSQFPIFTPIVTP